MKWDGYGSDDNKSRSNGTYCKVESSTLVKGDIEKARNLHQYDMEENHQGDSAVSWERHHDP